MSNVSQLVKAATGADSVSVIWEDGCGSAEVLATRKDAYGRSVMTRYDALVLDGELRDLSLSTTKTPEAEEEYDDSQDYRSEYVMGGQW